MAARTATILALALACPATAEGPAEPPSLVIARVESEGIENLWRLHSRVLTGGVPKGDRAFAELHRHGVRTVISVDAARPEVAAAERQGLRYIHLPIGYDGVDPARAAQLAKALLEHRGVCYVHCHHGVHRAPAAAAVAAVAAGLIKPEDGPRLLAAVGTGKQYRGLHRAVASARPIDPATLAELRVNFPSVAEPPPMAAAMAAIARSVEKLQSSESAGWITLADDPDFDPSHEAVLLREHFAELARGAAAGEREGAFAELLRRSESLAATLSDSLQSPGRGRSRASAAMAGLAKRCVECHARYRDTRAMRE